MNTLTTNHRYDYLASKEDQLWGFYITGTGVRYHEKGQDFRYLKREHPTSGSMDAD